MIVIVAFLILGVILGQRRQAKRIEQSILRAHGMTPKRRWWS